MLGINTTSLLSMIYCVNLSLTVVDPTRLKFCHAKPPTPLGKSFYAAPKRATDNLRVADFNTPPLSGPSSQPELESAAVLDLRHHHADLF